MKVQKLTIQKMHPVKNKTAGTVPFLIRKATLRDLSGIMNIMTEAADDRKHPDWFVADDESYVRQHISDKGYTVVAQTADDKIAGFFIVKYPDLDDNLGNYLGMNEEALRQVAVMDSAVVGRIYRGAGLQGRMLEAAEEFLDKNRFHYLMCTIHPDNRFSRYNMESHGYEVKKVTQCYGGLDRCILIKKC